jgi:hypothetical protein
MNHAAAEQYFVHEVFAGAAGSARDSFCQTTCVDAKAAFRLPCSPNMKKWGVSARKVACHACALGCFVSIQLVGARGARAESSRKVEGFEALGTLGYGFSDDLVYNDKRYDPYGVMLGLDLGYTFPFGLRIGADASYGFGRRLEQTSSTGEVDATDATSIALDGSLGYDLLLSAFRLRGAVDMGAARYWFDGGRIEGPRVPGAAFYIGPKIVLLWQYRAFELGLQSKYWATSADGPGNNNVVQVGLISGVRF